MTGQGWMIMGNYPQVVPDWAEVKKLTKDYSQEEKRSN